MEKINRGKVNWLFTFKHSNLSAIEAKSITFPLKWRYFSEQLQIFMENRRSLAVSEMDDLMFFFSGEL